MTVGVLLLMVPTRSLVVIALWMGVWGAAYSALPVVLQTLVLRVSDRRSAEAATSLYVLVFNCAIATGALVGGIAIDGGGPSVSMFAGASCCAASLVAICVVREAAAAS